MTIAAWLAAHVSALPQHELEILAQEAWLKQLGASDALEAVLSLGEMRRQGHSLEWSEASLILLQNWMDLRSQGIPLQIITGYQDFLGHRYRVDRGTLVPRPETEFLVSECVAARRSRPPMRIAEVGVGSGVIAIEMLLAFADVEVVGSELVPEALTVASQNARRFGVTERFKILQVLQSHEVWSAFGGELPFDCVISNPPYLVAEADETTLEVSTHEPATALFAPHGDPLFYYRKILSIPSELRAPKCEVWTEIPHERASEIFALAQSLGWQAELKADLTGRPRVLRASTVS